MILQNHIDVIKQVGINGQISLGKEYAGKQIQISKYDDGTLVIKPGRFIPDSEQWLYRNGNLEKLEAALSEAKASKRRDNFKEIEKKILADD